MRDNQKAKGTGKNTKQIEFKSKRMLEWTKYVKWMETSSKWIIFSAFPV